MHLIWWSILLSCHLYNVCILVHHRQPNQGNFPWIDSVKLWMTVIDANQMRCICFCRCSCNITKWQYVDWHHGSGNQNAARVMKSGAQIERIWWTPLTRRWCSTTTAIAQKSCKCSHGKCRTAYIALNPLISSNACFSWVHSQDMPTSATNSYQLQSCIDAKKAMVQYVYMCQ